MSTESTVLRVEHASVLHQRPPKRMINSFKQHSNPPVGIAPILWLELHHHFFEFVDFIIVDVILDRVCRVPFASAILRLLFFLLRYFISGCKNEALSSFHKLNFVRIYKLCILHFEIQAVCVQKLSNN